MLSGDAAAVISAAIVEASRTDPNPTIRDIQIGAGQCPVTAPVGAYVDAAGTCWRHSHPHEGNVYDFSQWTLQHPGNKVIGLYRLHILIGD